MWLSVLGIFFGISCKLLILTMNSKRQRRPNVRLVEIGDVPAAFACAFSHKTKQNLGHKSYESETDVLKPNNAEQNQIYSFPAMENPPEVLFLGSGVSPKISDDLQPNMENNDPNSSKSGFNWVSSDEIDMNKLKLNFGTITRKCRVMKRRGRSGKGANCVFGSVWNSKLSPQFSFEDAEDCSVKEFVKYASDKCYDYDSANRFKGLSDNETPATSEEACEFDEGNNVSPVCGGSDVNSVTSWLEEQGFGKYANLFEKHEVDEEALLLLTLEDLKEMGMLTVGPRRKLYTAIQRLRKGAT